MSDKTPGAIINVRWGQYVDGSGFLRDGWLHDHVCMVPGCGLVITCHEASEEYGYDGQTRWSCQVDGPDKLCALHADADPCDDCGDYGHTSEQCPEAVSTEDGFASWDKADWEEYAADVAYQLDKDGQ